MESLAWKRRRSGAAPRRNHCHHARTRSQRGYTLMEALVALAVAAFLTTTAVPALQSFVQRNRLAGEVNHFISHLSYARSEAVRRGLRVVMCQSQSGTACERVGGWHHGWITFADPNANRELDPDEQPLRVEGPVDEPLTILSGRRRRVVYQATGFSPGTNATFTFCDPGAPEMVRAVIISNTGRARFSTEGPGGRRLNCP